MKVSAPLLCLLLLATSCSTPHTTSQTRFSGQEKANLVVRYYTDDISYVLKPEKTDGPFLRVLRQDAVMDVARQQPGRELAVVILIPYGDENQATAVQQKWTHLLTAVGYERVVFLRARGGMQVDGLPVLASGG